MFAACRVCRHFRRKSRHFNRCVQVSFRCHYEYEYLSFCVIFMFYAAVLRFYSSGVFVHNKRIKRLKGSVIQCVTLLVRFCAVTSVSCCTSTAMTSPSSVCQPTIIWPTSIRHMIHHCCTGIGPNASACTCILNFRVTQHLTHHYSLTC